MNPNISQIDQLIMPNDNKILVHWFLKLFTMIVNSVNMGHLLIWGSVT